MTCRIALVGAGSHFTNGLVRDLTHSEVLTGSELCLMDLDHGSLDVVSRLVKRMVNESGADIQIESTTDRREALDSADFVITTILVGGLGVCKTDIDIPMKYGVYQTVGDTVGPGGLVRALRTIPAIVEIARDMEDVCPDAWLFNYSNPLTCLSVAVREATSIKMAGLCHGIRGTIGALSGFLGCSPREIQFLATGVNHLTWLLDLGIQGKDAYPRLRETLHSSDLPGWPISSHLCRIFGYFPSPGDRHVAEFFPYFLTDDTKRGSKYGLRLRDVERMQKSKEERIKNLLAQADGRQPLGDLNRPSGEEVIGIIESMIENRNQEFVVNIPNEGYVRNLPDGAIIELHALAGSYGIRAMHMGKMPQSVLGITLHRIVQQELTTRAALTGDRSLALQALLLDPLVRSVEDGESMLDELLQASSDFLPQFPT